MPDDFEPEEDLPTPPAPGEVPVIDFKISNYDLGRMMDASIATAMQHYVGRSVEKWVEKKVHAAVDRLVKDITKESIQKAVEKALTEGWGKVNEWGEKRGETVTLSSVVREGLMAMATPDRDTYNNNRRISPMQKIVEDMAQAGVKEGLEPLVKEAKEQLKAQLDLSIGKTLRMTMGELVK